MPPQRRGLARSIRGSGRYGTFSPHTMRGSYANTTPSPAIAGRPKRTASSYPLYAWTKAVIADPAKKAKYIKSFSIHVGGAEVYAKRAADALEAELLPLVGAGVVTRLAKHDTNPANSPQMPEKYRAES